MTRVLLVSSFASLSTLAACSPFPATLPTTSCDRAPELKVAPGDVAVASVLGCHARIVEGCRAPAATRGAYLAKDLDGPCVGATHVARGETGGRVELVPLSLGDYRIAGTFRGLERQPRGPYETYDVRMYLAQEGQEVNGLTQIATLDGEYWGDVRFSGHLEGNVLFFADAELLDDNLGLLLAWCARSGYLVVDPREGRLTGPWTACGCAPGTLEVTRVADPPRVILPRRATVTEPRPTLRSPSVARR